MNFKIKAAATAIALALSGAAHAAPIGTEGLFFSAFNGDSTAANSIVINLGLTTADFRANPLAPISLGSAESAALTGWLTGLGAGASNVVWSVTGVSTGDRGNEGNIPPSALYGGLSTASDIETVIPSWGLFGGLDQFPLNVKNFRDGVNANLSGTNAFSALNRTQEYFVIKDGGPAFNSQGGLNQSLPFYAFFADADEFFFGGDFSKFNGTWNLSFAPGASAALSYSAVSAIPLPGAVWLLGSAVAGLAAAKRRRA